MATSVAQKDFFISYNKADRAWAEWIAWQLKEAGYTVIIQAWHMRPGSNFVLEMDKAAKEARRVLAVLSPDYLASTFTAPEWADGVRHDPTGASRVLVPVRVRECRLDGLLASIVYIDLVGLQQAAAHHALLDGLLEDGTPPTAPPFPGEPEAASQPPAFPGPTEHETLWLVPHRRNPYFTGREETLGRLRATFASGQGIVTQAITGLGGMGKTQTALEYAWRYQQDYQAVFWVQAETNELLIGDFGKIAALLQLPEREAQKQEEMVAAVMRWLETHAGWLLVLDNVEDTGLARQETPLRGSGHVLLTMREQAPGGVAQRAPLEPLPLDEAARFLLRRANLLAANAPLAAAPAEQQTQARAIAEALGSLPLALDQAGAYIDEAQCSLKGYLDLYQKQRAALLRRRGTNATDHAEPVAATWKLAFAKLEQANPAAADLLRLCAFLHPEAIPEDLFPAGAKALTPALQRAVKDALQWDEAIAALRRFSLIERQPEKQTLALHRLVQAVLQDDLSAAARKRWAERAVRVVSAAFPDVQFEVWERCQQLLPHALICADHIEAGHLVSGEAAYVLNQAGYYLKQRAQYVESLPLYQRALVIYEKILGLDHPFVATSLGNLAGLYHDQGQYEEALPLYQRALAIREQVYGPNRPEVAIALNNLAYLYQTQKQYEEALPLYQRALAIREQTLGPNHPSVAKSLNNLAMFYQDQGQYAEALSLHQRALAIREQVLRPEHPEVAYSLNNLASLYYTQGQYTEALPLYQRALAIWERTVPDHPNAAITLGNIVSVLLAMGQLDEAREYAARAQAIRAKRKETGG